MTAKQIIKPESLKFTWERDPNGGGFTGRVPGEWTAYVLNNGSWTLYKWGQIKHHASGKQLSVFSAKSMSSKAAN